MRDYSEAGSEVRSTAAIHGRRRVYFWPKAFIAGRCFAPMALLSDLVRSYVNVVLHPREFFAETPSPTAIEGAAAAVAVALATVIATLAMGGLLADLFGSQGYPEAASAVWNVIGKFVVFAFVGVFLLWIVAGLVMHVVVATSTNGGSIGETLGVTGYGMLPSLLQTFVGIGIAYVHLQSVHLSGGPEAVTAQLQTVFQRRGPVSMLVNWGFIAWQAAIWVVGLNRVHDITPARALIGAGVVALGLGLLG